VSATNEKAAKGRYERIKVHGKVLEGNLEGDSPDRDVSVYLPPSYETERNRRYPVIYLLHGYGNTTRVGSGRGRNQDFRVPAPLFPPWLITQSPAARHAR
jgi:hypothetical protein